MDANALRSTDICGITPDGRAIRSDNLRLTTKAVERDIAWFFATNPPEPRQRDGQPGDPCRG